MENQYCTLHTSKKTYLRSDISLRSSHSGHVRSGSYDNIPTPGPQVSHSSQRTSYSATELINSFQAAQFPSDPPGSYEAISFPGRRSAETEPSLQSVGLVAEACRDYERREPRGPEPVNRAAEPRQSVTRQNSGGSLGGHARLPPPYQSPPGPPPPYQPPPMTATTSPQRQVNKQPSPQVLLGLLHVWYP